jgi:hypothetical protein
MSRIDGPAIEPDIRNITVQLEVALAVLVTRLTKRLELAEIELVHVAMVRLDVVGDARRRHDPAIKAEFAERVLQEL